MRTLADVTKAMKQDFRDIMREAGIPWDSDSKRFGNVCGYFTARGICFRLLPKNTGGKRLRRLRVQCPECGAWISSGKLSAHKHGEPYGKAPRCVADRKSQSAGE